MSAKKPGAEDAFKREDLSMSAKKPDADDKKATTVVANGLDGPKGALKHIGGSQNDDWNKTLVNQTGRTLWLKNSDNDTRDQQYDATIAGLIGIGPKDEIEGMIAAQLLGAHNAAMECYCRAMNGEQTFRRLQSACFEAQSRLIRLLIFFRKYPQRLD